MLRAGPMVLAALLVAQAPPPTKAELLADVYGETLGAAASCPALAHERLDAVSQRAAAHLKAAARDRAVSDAAGARLADGVARGRRAVESGSETCVQALSEFANLEHDLAQ
jgi:hypothetical protein